jgi:endonuclease/exonuclease/phosphatase (EEP) superfamily protein YafD
LVILWAVLGALVLMALLTWWQPGASREIAVLTCLAPWMYVGAWPALGVSIAWHDWPAVGLASALVGSHLAFVGPTMRPWSTAAPADGPWRLTVYDQNVLYSNNDLGGVERQIAELAPDVITLEELSYRNVTSLRDSGVLAAYPYHRELLHEQGRGFGVWSKVPLTDAEFWPSAGHQQFAATLRPPGQPAVSLIVIHAEAPVDRLRSPIWVADLLAIGERIAATARPVLIVGDFNATTTMRRFAPVLATGVVDAAQASGNGWRRTWPAYRGLVPAVMRIDHCLYSPDLTVTAYRLADAAGSDHRPVVVTLAHSMPSPGSRLNHR